MNEIKIFNNTEFGSLSVTNTDRGIYFFLGEICRCLGYTKQAKGNTYLRKEKIKNICEILEIKGLSQSDNLEIITLNTDFDNIRITEDSLYDLILESKAKNARKFRKWVTREVLPQIRKTGGYIPISTQDDDLTIMAKAHQILERTIAQKDQLISQLKPKADTYDMIMDADGTFSMNQVAKQVGMGEYHLFAYLRGKKILFYEGTDNVPYERFRKNGCFKVIDTVSPDGKSHSTTRVTQKGLDYICKIIRKDNEEVAV